MKLTDYELRATRAIVCAIFPAGADPRVTVDVGDLDLEAFARYATEDVPFEPALGFRAVIWFTLLAPLFVLGKFKTFLGLEAGERDRVVAALVTSSIYPVRALFVFFKAFASLYYFTSERARAQVLGQERDGSGARPRPLVAAASLARSKEEVRHAS